MTAVELANLALVKLGVTQTIAAMNENSREALTANIVYDTTLRRCLRRHPWSFATKYLALSLTHGRFWKEDPTQLVLVEAWSNTFTYQIGDTVRQGGINYYAIASSLNQAPPNVAFWSTSPAGVPTALQNASGDWLYSYRYPVDCIFARRVVPPGDDGRRYNETPIEFRRHRDENGLLIATNQQDAQLEYTMLDCIDLFTDDWFIDYFTSELAAAMAPGLERAQKSRLEAMQAAELAYQTAATTDMREQQQHKEGDAPWINARGDAPWITDRTTWPR